MHYKRVNKWTGSKCVGILIVLKYVYALCMMDITYFCSVTSSYRMILTFLYNVHNLHFNIFYNVHNLHFNILYNVHNLLLFSDLVALNSGQRKLLWRTFHSRSRHAHWHLESVIENIENTRDTKQILDYRKLKILNILKTQEIRKQILEKRKLKFTCT